jgi:hypothetical protein
VLYGKMVSIVVMKHSKAVAEVAVLVMCEVGIGNVGESADPRQPIREVNILAVHEEALIESTNTVKCVPANRKASPR